MQRVWRSLLVRCAGVLLVAALCGPGTARAAEAGGEKGLEAKYHSLRGSLQKNQFGAPIHLESKESGDTLRVDMYGVLSHPFAVVKGALASPANWCDITPVHLNIKACTYSGKGGAEYVTLYSGRKYYQPPGDAYPLKLRFDVVAREPEYLELSLSAREGPFNTSDHRIVLQAVPLDGARTFVHFSYAYSSGTMARMAVRGYLNTLGRDKVGFSLERGEGGKLFYVSGVRGAIERNTMRYYLAVESYLDTLKYPQERRFEERIGRWYDLTARYPRQLDEMGRKEYLADKRHERKNQIRMQQTIGR